MGETDAKADAGQAVDLSGIQGPLRKGSGDRPTTPRPDFPRSQMGCKPGCVLRQDGEAAHRTCDCVTVEELFARIKAQDEQILRLKAEVYDAWQER